MELQQKISKQINFRLINKKIDCIVESIDDSGIVCGRTYKDAPEVDGLVYIKTKTPVIPGDIIKVKITGADAYDLKGIL